MDECRPEVIVRNFRGRQPYRLVLLGEKTSLADVLKPIARDREVMLVLPSGEVSDTLIHEIAKTSSADGRPTIVFYFSDCDPSGFQMPISVARKLQALRDLKFPTLEIEVHPVALTFEQVRTYGLPCTPLKDTERRADKWKKAFGVEQTEIDALAALRPDVLRTLAHEAIAPFFDAQLATRVWLAQQNHQQEAQQLFDKAASRADIETLLNRARAMLDPIREQLRAIQNDLSLSIDSIDVDLPELTVPEAEVTGLPCTEPIYRSAWDWIEATQRLRDRKAYVDRAEGDAA